MARVAALFRRVEALAEAGPKEEVLERGELRLDAMRLAAEWRGQSVGLTLTEFWMVHTLARTPGHVKSQEQLMQDARLVVDDGTITSHVKRIRKKFVLLDAGFDHIESVYGMGYRWKP